MFCPRQMECPEYARFNLDLFSKKFDDLDSEEAPKLPSVLTPERRSYVILHASMFSQWLDGLRSEGLADALAGRPTPGLKAAYGRKPPRKWADQKAAESALLDVLSAEKAFKREILSPAEAEKAVGKKRYVDNLAEHVAQGDPAPTLVPAESHKETIVPYAERFADLTAGDVSDLL